MLLVFNLFNELSSRKTQTSHPVSLVDQPTRFEHRFSFGTAKVDIIFYPPNFFTKFLKNFKNRIKSLNLSPLPICLSSHLRGAKVCLPSLFSKLIFAFFDKN